MEGTLDAQSVSSINPASFDQEGLKLDLTKAINNYYADMHISGISGINPSSIPDIEVVYNQGRITFSGVQGVKLRPNRSDHCVEVIYTHPPSTVKLENYQDWTLAVTANFKLIAKFYPTSKPPSVLREKVTLFARLFWEGLQQEFQLAEPYSALVFPEEAPVAAGTKELLPIVIKVGPILLKASKGLGYGQK